MCLDVKVIFTITVNHLERLKNTAETLVITVVGLIIWIIHLRSNILFIIIYIYIYIHVDMIRSQCQCEFFR